MNIKEVRNFINSDDLDYDVLIEYYQKKGNVDDLISLLNDEEARSSVLYVLAELGPKARRVWKRALEYVGSDHFDEAHWAINLVHAYATDQDSEELMACLLNVNLEQDGLFEAVFDMFLAKLSKFEILIKKLFQLSIIRKVPSGHGVGLSILSFPENIDFYYIKYLNSLGSIELNLYVYLYVALYRREDEEFFDLMPINIKEGVKLSSIEFKGHNTLMSPFKK